MGYLVDVEQLFKRILDDNLTGVLSLPESDVDTVDDVLPLVIIVPGTGTGTGNGDLRLAQVWPITFHVLDQQRDGMSALAAAKATVDDVTEVLVEHAPRSRYAGLGAVTGLLDVALFARQGQSALGVRDIVQFTGTFTYTVQPT